MKLPSQFKLKYLLLSLSVATISACDYTETPVYPDTPDPDKPVTPTPDPDKPESSLPEQFTIDQYKPFEALHTFSDGTQQVQLTVDIETEYAHMSLYVDNQLAIDNINIPSKGENVINMLLNLPNAGEQTLKFVARGGTIEVKKAMFTPLDLPVPMFKDIAEERGMITAATYKYSGPAVADIDNDGDYDFALNNHNFVSTQVVTNNDGDLSNINPIYGEGTVPDLHGSAWGDYDNDGDLDLMQSVGGANGTSDSSYELLRNNGDGTFTNVSKEAGISTPARGRAPRWADFDNDGHLDLLLVNAKTPNTDTPQQLFYRNNGDGTFTSVRVPGVEEFNAERVLMLDYNRDGIEDILMVSSYSPVSLWKGNGDFTFTDVSAELLPDSILNGSNTFGAVSVDVDNDGRPDLYLARGLPLYQLSNKSIDYNPVTKSVDFRDNAEKGTTLINFTSDGDITLSEMDMVFRSTYTGNFPVFLGENKVRKPVKATGFQENQYPPEMIGAPESLTISQSGDAAGWPEERTENGLYIGFKDGKWIAETVRDGDLFWNIAFKLDEITSLDYDWTPNNHNRRDVLLLNKEDGFVDATEEWNIPLGGNAWGVTSGDFNNNGWNDLVVYRYGFLKERVADLLLLNTGKGSFQAVTMHGASDPEDKGHGDMGQAFDFDLDGKVDMLNGSDELGKWYLYQNQIENAGHYVLIDVKYSPLKNVDPYGAEVIVTTENNKEYAKRVGSAGAVFSQSMLNIMHFGLGDETAIKTVKITWRNGETVTFNDISADAIYTSNSEETPAESPAPTAVMFDPANKRLSNDATYQLEPIFSPLNAVNSVSYESSDTQVATIDSNGLITADATNTGIATITVTSLATPAVTAPFEVNVSDAAVYVSDIALKGADDTLYAGESIQLTAELTTTIADSDADDMSVTWSSNDTAVATVRDTGEVTGVTAGAVTITATANGSEPGQAVVAETVNFDVAVREEKSGAFDDNSKYMTTHYTDEPLVVTFNFNAGSGDTVNASGIKYKLREMTSAWGLVKDYIPVPGADLSVAGTQSGQIEVIFDLSDESVTPTAELPEGNFHFLFFEFDTEDGQHQERGIGWAPGQINIIER